MNFIIYSIEIN